MRSFGGWFARVVLVFLVLCGVGVAGDGTNEIKALIGLKIQGKPLSDNKNGNMTLGEIPNWKCITEYGSGWVSIEFNKTHNIKLDLFYKNKKYALVSYIINTTSADAVVLDATQVDAQILPMRIVNDKVMLKKENYGFMNPICKNESYGVGYIVGIGKPEAKYFKHGCSHWTKQIKSAWLVNKNNGGITEIPTLDVACFEQGDMECDF